MSIATILKTSMALPLVAVLALAGCGGGGGGTAAKTGGPMAPNTGSGQLPPASPPAPTLAELIPDPTEMFGAVSKALEFDYSAALASASDGFSVASVASDGDNGFHVTYVIDGTETTVHFSKDDFATRDTTSYVKDVDGRQYWFWSYAGQFDGENYGIGSDFDYFDALGSHHPDGARLVWTYGAPTGPGDMPTGTATYTGHMYADAYDNTLDSISTSVARSRVRGSLVLTADFADAAVEGRIFRLNIQRPGVDYADRQHLPSSTRIEVSDGEIAGGNFTATLTGVDDNANAPLSESVHGFTGDVSGEFYGPNAREFGAAVTASRATDATDDWAWVGYLGGTRADVVGQHTDNEPLQAGVNRLDYSSSSPRIVAQDAANRITAIEADDAGGYSVSYLVDGTAQTVSLSTGDLGGSIQSRPEAYSKRSGALAVFFRRPYYPGRVPQGLHYNVKDWGTSVYPDGTSTAAESAVWASVVHGTRTASASMPQTGTATYAGRAAAYVFAPAPGEGRASVSYAEGYSGSLTLLADFAAGSVSGRISGLEHSPAYFDSGTYSAVSGEFAIADGRIQGNALSGSLSGLGYDGTVSGAFYGPAVAEAAGVMQATGADGKLLHGWFGGARQ